MHGDQETTIGTNEYEKKADELHDLIKKSFPG